jgi:hypothetical protein
MVEKCKGQKKFYGQVNRFELEGGNKVDKYGNYFPEKKKHEHLITFGGLC